MMSSSQRSQEVSLIQEVALGLGEPEGPQEPIEKGTAPGKGADGGLAVVGMGRRPIPTTAVALLQGPSSHRVHAAVRPWT